MNMNKTIAFTIASFLFIPVAFAGSPQGKANKPNKREKVQRMLDKFDKNGDRMLDANELEAVIEFRQQRKGKRKAQRKKRAMQRFDQNHDGQLQPAEREAMRQHRQQKRAEMKQRFDANGDGQLDQNERRAARRARVNMRFDRLLTRFDSNRDGAISWTEVQAVGQASGQGHAKQGKKGERIHKIFRRADSNNDNIVTRDEFKQAIRQRMDKHGAGQGHARGQRQVGGPGTYRAD